MVYAPFYCCWKLAAAMTWYFEYSFGPETTPFCVMVLVCEQTDTRQNTIGAPSPLSTPQGENETDQLVSQDSPPESDPETIAT